MSMHSSGITNRSHEDWVKSRSCQVGTFSKAGETRHYLDWIYGIYMTISSMVACPAEGGVILSDNNDGFYAFGYPESWRDTMMSPTPLMMKVGR